MTDQEIRDLLKANNQELMLAMKEAFQESEQRMSEKTERLIQESEKRIRKDIMHDVAILMDAQFMPQFKLLAEGQQSIIDQVKDLEKRIDAMEEKIYDYN